MTFYGRSGTEYVALEQPLCHGGEGSIYEVVNKPEIVLKIYHSSSEIKLAKKIYAIQKQSEKWSDDFKWFCTPPLDLVYNESNHQFAGYVMRRLKESFKPLCEIYDSHHSAEISYKNKVRAAMNLCSLTYLAHKNNVVIGDYNQKNIGVTSNGILTLFDNDSFQITDANGHVFRCTVGVQEEMAPEILAQLKKERADLITVQKDVYNESTDNYTLAIHIFHLLMNGAHPFNRKIEASKLPESKTISSVTISLVEAAMKRDFIIAHPKLYARKPDWVPDYNILSFKLRDCFERAFVEGKNEPNKRPGPEEFFEALQEYSSGLVVRSCGHVHHKDYIGNCEWCRIQKIKR